MDVLASFHSRILIQRKKLPPRSRLRLCVSTCFTLLAFYMLEKHRRRKIIEEAKRTLKVFFRTPGTTILRTIGFRLAKSAPWRALNLSAESALSMGRRKNHCSNRVCAQEQSSTSMQHAWSTGKKIRRVRGSPVNFAEQPSSTNIAL
jgi:hypothetical protein